MLHFFQLFLVGLIFQLTQAQYYHLNKNKMNYNDAVKYCNSKEIRLVKITDSQTNAAVFELASKNGMGTYWMNGNDIAIEGTWVDTENKPLVYKNWYKGEPNNWGGNQNCLVAAYHPNEMWFDIGCNTLNSVICEIVIENYHTNKNKMTYNDAVKYCNDRNMGLVKIPNSEVNVNVYNLALKHNLGTYWMNGNDIAIGGTWVNTENKPLVYKNWYTGEPNNWGGNQNCLVAAYHPNEMWFDIGCDTLNSVICYNANDKKISCKD
uniref:C-type lectin-like protein n=1 Tax=Girardia tigrina TaxID=6162 RepID=Q24696_GIRTI|nr:C-type lectin-like protein [Girardia tigrina]